MLLLPLLLPLLLFLCIWLADRVGPVSDKNDTTDTASVSLAILLRVVAFLRTPAPAPPTLDRSETLSSSSRRSSNGDGCGRRYMAICDSGSANGERSCSFDGDARPAENRPESGRVGRGEPREPAEPPVGDPFLYGGGGSSRGRLYDGPSTVMRGPWRIALVLLEAEKRLALRFPSVGSIARDCRDERPAGGRNSTDPCRIVWRPRAVCRFIRRRRRRKHTRQSEQMNATDVMGMKIAAKIVPRAMPLDVVVFAACPSVPRKPDPSVASGTADELVAAATVVVDFAVGVPVAVARPTAAAASSIVLVGVALLPDAVEVLLPSATAELLGSVDDGSPSRWIPQT